MEMAVTTALAMGGPSIAWLNRQTHGPEDLQSHLRLLHLGHFRFPVHLSRKASPACNFLLARTHAHTLCHEKDMLESTSRCRGTQCIDIGAYEETTQSLAGTASLRLHDRLCGQPEHQQLSRLRCTGATYSLSTVARATGKRQAGGARRDLGG